jgi:predicted transglutaminase-like cysteine proteinase
MTRPIMPGTDRERYGSAAESDTPTGRVPGEYYEALKRDALTAAGTSIATKRSAENR